MTEENKYNVVQANNFVRETSWTLKRDTIKIFKLLISRIDTKKPPKDNTVFLSKSEVINILKENDLDKNYNYTYARSRMKDLITGVKVLDDKEREVYVSLVQKVVWNKNIDIIECKFSEEVMPYLIVANKFLQYDIQNIRGFDSKYGIIFYENLLSYYKQYKNNDFTISVEKLRRLTDTEKKLLRFDNWERTVLKKGIDDLNTANTEILAKYEKIKHGKTVKEIIFSVRPRTSYKETSYEDVENPSFLIKKYEEDAKNKQKEDDYSDLPF